MNALKHTCIVAGISVLAYIPATFTKAQGLGGQIVPQCAGGICGLCDLMDLAQNLLNFAIFFASLIAGLMFAYAGWLMLSHFGDEKKITQARKIFLNVFIGLVLVLSAWLIVDTIIKTLTGGSFGPWNSACR